MSVVFHSSLLTSAALMLSACGSSNADLKVTLETGLKVHSQFTDSSAMMKFGIRANVATCLQPEILAGFKVGGQEGPIYTFPVKLRSELMASSGSGVRALGNASAVASNTAEITDWLFNHSELDVPIEIPVPKGQSVGFGLFGAYYEPHDDNGDGICDESATSDDTARNSFSLYGTAEAVSPLIKSVSLNIWAIQTSPIVAYQAPTRMNGSVVLNDFKCLGTVERNACSYQNLVSLQNSISQTTKIKEVDFLKSVNNNLMIHHFVNLPNGETSYFPSVDDLNIKFTDTQGGMYQPQLVESEHDTFCFEASSYALRMCPSPSPTSLFVKIKKLEDL